MTPIWMQYAMPAVHVISAALVMSRFPFREYPALVSSMALGMALQVSKAWGFSPEWLGVAQWIGRAAVVCEIARCSRIRLNDKQRASLVAAGIAASAFLSSVPALSLTQRAYLLKEYVHLSLWLALAGIVAYRAARPVLEVRRDRVYRFGNLIWLTIVTASCLFVRGGIGYAIFGYSRHTWQVANLATYYALLAVVPAVALAMWASAPGRKRAAKRTDGKTVTGFIEFERAA